MYGPGYAGGPGMYGGYGPGLTPGQAIADRNLAIAQASARRNLIQSQMVTNQAVRQVIPF